MDSVKEKWISDYPLYLFNEGTNYYSYNTLGAHAYNDGYIFAVWAPNAKAVSVVGDFNGWDPTINAMSLRKDFGVWECHIPNAKIGMYYKFLITSMDGKSFYKADPYAFMSELRPGDASRLTALDDYEWQDAYYMNNKKSTYDNPAIIYEVHLGSWKQKEDGAFYTYKELADELVDYVKDMKFTHIELMALAEHPFDGSWGYQVTGYYSITSRYGTPQDFKYFVDKCHSANLKVIIDWIPAHFPKDSFGLANFDGTALYEHADKRIGEHLEWGTKVFNLQRGEVKSFLLSNAMFWMDVYHIDGLRVDAVSSMLYLDYNRKHGGWLPNKHGGNENLDSIDFFQQLNTEMFAKFPNCMMIAEESTAWANVTKPTDIGGLGFNYKWNMGWMNDILRYLSLDPVVREKHHECLTFSMHYAFSENYILPLSHDEVVHGKASLLNKMFGNYEQKFATLRAFYAYMMAHPGKKLLFMGGEFGQFIEWNVENQLDWLLLEYDKHRQLQGYVKQLNEFYFSNTPLWENDSNWDGFEWINASDKWKNMVSFMRHNKGKKESIIAISNFSAKGHENHCVGISESGSYEIIFNSDDIEFGGSSTITKNIYRSTKKECDGRQHRIQLNVPPLTTLFIKKR